MQMTSRKRKQLTRGMIALFSVCLAGGALAVAVRRSQIRHQMQTDPAVATAWLIQVTHGPNHTLTRGSTVQRWANQHNIHALGDYEVLTGSFNGEPNGIEFWFDYASHTGDKNLECHRVGPTAFVDDLGQIYHGFLDFQGKTVGVYLPGYDHAAHRITANVRWMPRRPAAPFPVSRPMTFSVPLTASRRILPPASTLPMGPITVIKGGITVTLSDVSLSPPRLRSLYEGQRDLIFQLRIQGGEIADDNISMPLEGVSGLGTRYFIMLQGQAPSAQKQTITTRFRAGNTVYMVGNGSNADNLTITDPYGISLVPPSLSVAMPVIKPRKGQKASPFWIAPVTGAGKGTDCVQFHFGVQPPARSPKAMPPALIPFDIPIRVSTEAAP